MSQEKFNFYALKLVILLSFIFLLEINFPSYTQIFILNSSSLIQTPWTILTYMFLHANATHLMYNALALALFGSILEKIIGYKKFLIIFLIAGAFSGIVGAFFYESIIGASGAIYGILGFLVVIRPKMVVPSLGVPLPMIAAIILWSIFDLFGTFSPDGIAHIGHLSGLAIGIVLGVIMRSRYKIKEKKKETKVEISEKDFREWEDKYLKN